MGLAAQIKSPSLTPYPTMPGGSHTPALKRVFFKAFVITFIVALLFLLFIAEQTAGFDQSGKTTPKQFNVTNSSSDSVSPAASPPNSSNNLSTDSQTSSSGSSSNTQVTVNGQPVNVPENGTTTQTINNNGSTTTVTASGSHTDGDSSVNIDSSTTSNGAADNNSTSNIDVQSFNSSSP